MKEIVLILSMLLLGVFSAKAFGLGVNNNQSTESYEIENDTNIIQEKRS